MAKLISADLTNNKLCILEYTTTSGKILFIRDNNAFDAKIVSHRYTDKGVIIFDKPITTIGKSAFSNRYSLQSITIPNSVITIGEGAFRGCISLSSVIIPDGITKIGNMAFCGCESLTEFKGGFVSDDGRCLIIDGILNSFASAELSEYNIPDSVTAIGDMALSGCRSLQSITIPNSVKSIGKSAFEYCNNLSSIIIPDSVTAIGDKAFYNCQSIKKITIPDSITAISNMAFSGCESLQSITIPNSVKSIGDMAFRGCKSLTEFKGKFASDDGRCLIVYGVLNSFASAELSEYNIPNSVTAIGEGAFRGCDNLTSVTISNRVISIGEGAFYGCKSLSIVTIGKSVCVIFENAFWGCNIDTIICYPKTPPKIYKSFEKFNKIIVPTGYEEAYANSDWGEYLE